MKLLEDTRVATVHGTAFGQYGEGFLRMCYAVSEERIEQSLEKLGDYLPGLLPD